MAGSQTGDPRVIAALALMAARRQASNIDRETLDLFSADLTHPAQESDRYSVEVITEACERIGRAERTDGETAFPSLGMLLRVCRVVRTGCYWENVRAIAATAPKPVVPELPEPTKAEAKQIAEKFRDTVNRLIREKRIEP